MKYMQNITIVTFLSLGLAACGYSAKNFTDEGGETGGAMEPSGDVENPPEWHCRERIPNFTMKITIPGVDDLLDVLTDAHTAESCPYAISSDLHDPIPPKPYWWGLPDVISSYGEAFIEYNLSLLVGLDNTNQLHPMYVRRPGFEEPWEVTGWPDTRSGLIGNFPMWFNVVLGSVPESGLRPPIVTGTIFDLFIEMLTHPVKLPEWVPFASPSTTGRYLAYGMPCSTNGVNIGDGYTPLMESWGYDFNHPAAECPAFIAFSEVQPAHQLYPFGSGGYEVAVNRALEATACLDNGGEYNVALAAPSAGERDGLIWVNWPDIAALGTWIVAAVEVPPDAQELIEESLIVLDWLESVGFTWNMWPINASWKWSRWSHTGVCAFPASLGIGQGPNGNYMIQTHTPCPVEYLPVFPDVNLDELFEDFIDEYEVAEWRALGYCTLPMQAPPMKANVVPTLLPELGIGKPGKGFSGALFVEPLSDSSFDLISDAFQFVERDGIVAIVAASQAGELLMQQSNIPSGSVILGTSANSGELTAMSLALEIGRKLMAGETVMVILDTPDGKRRLHRYIVPIPPGSITSR